MLPKDTKSCKAKIKEKLHQTWVNDHFEKALPAENKPEPYSNELFKEAAIQWLVETDQVCLALSFFFFLQISDLTQTICSQLKPLNTQLSKGWSKSHHTPHVELPSQTASRHKHK